MRTFKSKGIWHTNNLAARKSKSTKPWLLLLMKTSRRLLVNYQKKKMIKRITNNIESNVSFTATNSLDYGPYAIFLLFFNCIYVDETAG